jgi:hypothetical protein
MLAPILAAAALLAASTAAMPHYYLFQLLVPRFNLDYYSRAVVNYGMLNSCGYT